MSRGPLLIVGASGRAASASAIRAGYTPFVIDLFGDEDTRRLCPVLTCPLDSYPHGFIELAERVPPMPWMYTGGVENYPEVIEAISCKRELMGNGPDVLKQVRDPFRLHEILSGKGLGHPWLNHPNGLSLPHGRLLRKPVRGSAGIGIRPANGDEIRDAANHRDEYYLQEFIDGTPVSVLCRSHCNQVQILGNTRQLIGTAWLHAPEFRYAGNIAPAHVPHLENGFLHAFRLTVKTGIQGVWGFDAIATEDDLLLLEVNPRYTAAMELMELAHRIPVLASEMFPAQSNRVYGKGIYYAATRMTFPDSGPWDDSLVHCTDVWRRPDYADVPGPGTTIDRGQPVLTIFAEGDTDEVVLHRLKLRAAELDRLFGIPASGAYPP